MIEAGIGIRSISICTRAPEILPGNFLRADVGPVKVVLPQDLGASADGATRLESEEGWVQTWLEGAQGTARVDGSMASYEQALPGVDVTLASTPDGIKERLVLGDARPERHHVPELDRFLQQDPVDGGSANAYDYAFQDPINNFDLDGRLPCAVKPKCVGGKAVRGAKKVGKTLKAGAKQVGRGAKKVARVVVQKTGKAVASQRKRIQRVACTTAVGVAAGGTGLLLSETGPLAIGGVALVSGAGAEVCRSVT